MKTILLSNSGKVSQVDEDTFDALGHFNWKEGTNGYALRSEKGAKIYLHREIMRCPEDMQVDHKDSDKLNNFRDNLHIVTQSLNGQRRKIQRNNTSGYRGVTFQQGSWKAQIYLHSKRICLGCFSNKVEAAIAYNKAAIEHFGPTAKLNTIPA